MDKEFKHIIFDIDEHIGTITINRPDVKNALDLNTISEIIMALGVANEHEQCRVLIITSKGDNFCTGADLKWMQHSSNLTYNENLEESRILAQLFYRIYHCRKMVITQVKGYVMGGANGIIAASDLVIAEPGTRFGFTEVKLGIVPATILPYILKRVPENKAKQMMLRAELFDAVTAKEINLIDEIIPENEQTEYIEHFISVAFKNGPNALQDLKDLITQLSGKPITSDVLEITAKAISTSRVSGEGQEGLKAFLDKRNPSWQS